MSVHAYFAERETLLDIFPDWPAEMGVVVLLEDVEGHHVSLFHQEESDRILGRLCRRLHLSPDDLILISPEGVGPEGSGHPRVRIRFSEDREVLDLLRYQKDLPERAHDYRINFEYIRDQGLGTGLDADLNPIPPDGEEPLVFLPIPPSMDMEDKWEAWVDPEEEPPAPEVDPVPSEERFQPFEDEGEDLAAYDVPASPDQVRNYRVMMGEISLQGESLELRLSDRRRKNVEIRAVQPIGFRDDLSDFLLAADVFDAREDGTDVRLRLPGNFFPPDMMRMVGSLPRAVRIGSTPWGIRVRPISGLTGLLLPWVSRPLPVGLGLCFSLALLMLMSGFPYDAASWLGLQE